MKTASAMPPRHSISEPTSALRRPPGEPGAGVSCVKTARFSPPMPCTTSDHRMATSAPSASRVASVQSPMKSPLAALRRARRSKAAAIGSGLRAAAEERAR